MSSFTFLCVKDIAYISLDVMYDEYITKGWVGGFVCVAQWRVSRGDVIAARVFFCTTRRSLLCFWISSYLSFHIGGWVFLLVSF